MDSDNLYFLIFFGIVCIGLLVGAAIYASSFPIPEPGVILLQTPDLNHKKIFDQPLIVTGSITRESNIYIFYIYNPFDYKQRVTIDFYLSLNLNRSLVDITYSTGNGFLIDGTQTLECQVTAVLKSVTTKEEENVFKGAGMNILHLTVTSEVVSNG